MAKVVFSFGIKSISGKLGDVVFRVYPNGDTIVSKLPDTSKLAASPAQLEQRQRMKRAHAYAHAAMADPDVWAIYQKRAAEENRQAYRVAVSDSLNGIDLLSGK